MFSNDAQSLWPLGPAIQLQTLFQASTANEQDNILCSRKKLKIN